ncbi:MAG: hypothetical protein Q4G07_08050, partial [Oscillospiraceae bacterium]|nr:hypothetical protein [Oscillospiraceae bacterium]
SLLNRASPISIHAPHAGRGPVRLDLSMQVKISIHAPRAGRDVLLWKFPGHADAISIHARGLIKEQLVHIDIF